MADEDTPIDTPDPGWFGSEGGGDGEKGFCLGDDGEAFCFDGGEELSEEQMEELEDLMESFRRFGLDDLLEDFFGESGFERWFDGTTSAISTPSGPLSGNCEPAGSPGTMAR